MLKRGVVRCGDRFLFYADKKIALVRLYRLAFDRDEFRRGAGNLRAGFMGEPRFFEELAASRLFKCFVRITLAARSNPERRPVGEVKPKQEYASRRAQHDASSGAAEAKARV